MDQKKYWQSFGQMNKSEAYEASLQDEFKEPLLPLEDLDENLLDAKTPRRDFLKYLGFSTAAAALAAAAAAELACCCSIWAGGIRWP